MSRQMAAGNIASVSWVFSLVHKASLKLTSGRKPHTLHYDGTYTEITGGTMTICDMYYCISHTCLIWSAFLLQSQLKSKRINTFSFPKSILGSVI